MVSSNDVQRLFIQSILSRRVVSQKVALKIWEKCIDAVKAADDSLEVPFNSDRNSWDNLVSSINDALNPLDLEFAHMHDEFTGKEMCVLVNRKGDEIAQMATDYSAVEIAYFKAVVEQIMLAPNESYTVSSLAALREVGTLKANMSKTQAEIVLNSFVAKGWLIKSKQGRYSLSTRALLELQPYLRSTYPDEIVECTICMEMITRGIACYTAHCKARLHHHCLANYRRRNQNCPACGENWSSDANTKKLLSVGEGAFVEGQDKGARRSRRRNGADGDDENEDDEDELMDVDESQLSETQTQAKKKGKKTPQDNRMDVDGGEEQTPPPRTQKRKGRR